MKKIALVVIGIGLFLSVFTTAEAQVAFDGKNLVFPRGACLSPVDVSSLKFDLENVPPDKEFVKGKIFEFKFTTNRYKSMFLGNRYAIFTKWTGNKIEMFFYPVSPKTPDDKPFLDCTLGNNGEYACAVRGCTTGSNYRMVFQELTIRITADDGNEAYSEAVGQIPVPAIQTKTSSLQP
jgi:hypothetical protein